MFWSNFTPCLLLHFLYKHTHEGLIVEFYHNIQPLGCCADDFYHPFTMTFKKNT